MSRQSRSWALLFVDVSSAFTFASRFLLFGSALPLEQVGLELASSGVAPDSITFLLEEVSSRGSLLARVGLEQ
eukprot:2240590-Prorocentrum_lima.AAC.1